MIQLIRLREQFFSTAEHDIFGEAVSDSEEEETNINIMEMEDENSRLSADDSMHTIDSTSIQVQYCTSDILSAVVICVV